MGLALLVVICLITFVSSYFFAAHTWWMPAVASTYGPAIDAQFTYTYIAMGVVFVAAQVALGWFAWRYRDRSQPVKYSHGNLRLEFTWTILTAILFVGLNLMGQKIWAEARFNGEAPDAPVKVEITGMQFQWYFRYPGPDGKFGKTDYTQADASAGAEAAIGLDTLDPASKDDIVVNTLVLPVNKEVEVSLRAQDVIHDFFVPALRFKQDAVPGLNIRLHFTPTTIGDYEVACAELCGLGHYRMRAIMKVVSDDDYQKFLAQKEAEKTQ